MSSSDPSDGNQSKPKKGMNEKKMNFIKKNFTLYRNFLKVLYIYIERGLKNTSII